MKFDPGLIFDVGMNVGDDAAYYLKLGYRVVGIDADPAMIEVVKAAFPQELKDNRLTLEKCAVSDRDGADVSFYLSENPRLNSLKASLTEYGGNRGMGVIIVKTRTLPSLFREHGLPHYCKIDTQGYDAVILATMSQLERQPSFISAECSHESDTESDEQTVEVLERLHALGYQKFKLVDQATLSVLKPKKRFYGEHYRRLDLKLRKMHTQLRPGTGFYGRSTSGPFSRLRELRRLKRRRSIKLNYDFPPGSSGPFGDDLESTWIDYDSAKKMLLYHRRDFYESKSAGITLPSVGFWCDWHAKLE